MAMIDAYRIGVELVLGGDLAAGVEALIPGFERLDARVTHANAEAADLAAGLRGVAEAAPGIGQAADQLGRLSLAMVSVNQAVEAWRSHGGVPEVNVPGQAGGGMGASPHRAVVTPDVAGFSTNAADVVADLGVRDGHGSRLRAGSRRPGGPELPNGGPDGTSGLDSNNRTDAPMDRGTHSGFDAVIPALLAGDLAKGRFDGVATNFDLSANRQPELVSLVLQASMAGADAAKNPIGVYASAVQVLPVYVQTALGPNRSEPNGIGALVEPARADDLSAIESGGRVFGADRVEEVIPTFARHGRGGGMGEVLVEPHRFVQQPMAMIHDTLAPVVGVPRVDIPLRERVTGVDAMRAYPSLAVEAIADWRSAPSTKGTGVSTHAPSRREVPWPALDTRKIGGVQRPIMARLNGIPEWLNAITNRPRTNADRTSRALESLSSGLTALGVSRAEDGAMSKIPEGWLNPSKNTATMMAGAPGAAAAGIAPALSSPYQDRSGGGDVAQYPQGYHPQGDQPGPVIQHITYIHLDDREIARAVTRYQLRMMGGNVSGTLRPDPSIAPHYGAHLLET